MCCMVDETQKTAGKALLMKKCAELNLKAYDNFESLVTDPETDALIIGSINPLHFGQIMAAINNGKHLMVEKPVVTDFEQLRRNSETQH
jgi:predicted dehydrogenase